MVKNHEFYIKRCLELAKNGLPMCLPNPSVGAVIVYDNRIIGEGFTSPYGGNHAEVNAINSVKDKSLLLKSTIYVSLEPCSHFGKTPPCADLILKCKIPNVVIGITDSNSKVSGNGIKKLVDAGCNVIVDVLENECYVSNKRFFTFHEKNRPYIILKWAQTENGFIAPITKNSQKPIWISNKFSRQLTHKWRAEEQAILVGTRTVMDDNPTLTTRNWAGKNPIRVVIDQNNRIPKNYNVFDNQAKTLLINNEIINFDGNIAQQISNFLLKKNIQSVIIEGGTKTIQTFIDANIWDEARVFKTKTFFENGIKAPVLNKKSTSNELILDDELLIYNNDYGNNI